VKYDTLPAFEQDSIISMCGMQALFTRIGEYISPDSLNDPTAALILRALKHTAQTAGGRIPQSPSVVLQTVYSWMADGKVSEQEFKDAEEAMLFHVMDRNIEPVVDAWSVHLKRVAMRDATMQAMQAYQSLDPGAMQGVKARIARIEQIGKQGSGLGIELLSGLDEILDATQHEVLTTGVPELDVLLRGGIYRSTASMYLGGPNSGKSMALTTCGAANNLAGVNVAIATLENPRPIQSARVIAAMMGIPTTMLNERRKQVNEFLESAPRGLLQVEYFSPLHTTIEQLRNWVDDLEQSYGEPFPLVIVDYTDKVGAGNMLSSRGGEYEAQRIVCEGFRDWMVQEKRYGLTATQAVRKPRNSPEDTVLAESDVSDSQHKIRIMDMMASINPRGSSYYWWIMRHRLANVHSQGVEAPHCTDLCRMGVWLP
jgi:hypothetical protein